jgi:hypothetical protein
LKFIRGKGYQGIIIVLACCEESECKYTKLMKENGADYIIAKPFNVNKFQDIMGIIL